MVLELKVVHAESFKSKKGDIWTKLFVPVANGMEEIFARGDLTSLVGCENVPFRLGRKGDFLNLYYDGEED